MATVILVLVVVVMVVEEEEEEEYLLVVPVVHAKAWREKKHISNALPNVNRRVIVQFFRSLLVRSGEAKLCVSLGLCEDYGVAITRHPSVK
jgi:hypothetical protein